MGYKVIKIVVKPASWKEGAQIPFLQLVDLQDLYLTFRVGKKRKASVGIISQGMMEKWLFFEDKKSMLKFKHVIHGSLFVVPNFREVSHFIFLEQTNKDVLPISHKT